jgi:hypothetical protein
MNNSQLHSSPDQKPASARGRMSNAHSVGGDLSFGLDADLGAVVQRAQRNFTLLTPGNISVLQRTIGNQAVARMLGRDAPTPNIHTPSSSPVIQTKLTVGAADDVYEQEADRIARTVVTRQASAPSQSIQRNAKSRSEAKVSYMAAATPFSIRRIQRTAPMGSAGGEVDPEVERRLRSSQSGGRPLPDTVRRAIEPTLGADLSSVKVHTGSQAVQLNRSLGAKAFTHGNHIYYGEGQSPHDLKLTAHEAVHTIQQGAISTGTIQRKKKQKRVVDTKKAEKRVPDNATRFTLTLGVWQADSNFLVKSTQFVFQKAAHQLFGGKAPKAPDSTGHSWVELRAFSDDDALVYSDSYGFHKGGVEHPDSNFHGQSGEDVLYRDYDISKEQFINVIGTAEAIAKEKPKYKVKGMNCTKFARTLVHAAGLSFMGQRVVPGAKTGPGKAFTPNRLYSAMKSKKHKTYALDADRKDSTYTAPPTPKVTLYMQPFDDTPTRFPLSNKSDIKSYQLDKEDPGWTKVILSNDTDFDETWYAKTDEFQQFLSQEED